MPFTVVFMLVFAFTSAAPFGIFMLHCPVERSLKIENKKKKKKTRTSNIQDFSIWLLHHKNRVLVLHLEDQWFFRS